MLTSVPPYQFCGAFLFCQKFTNRSFKWSVLSNAFIALQHTYRENVNPLSRIWLIRPDYMVNYNKQKLHNNHFIRVPTFRACWRNRNFSVKELYIFLFRFSYCLFIDVSVSWHNRRSALLSTFHLLNFVPSKQCPSIVFSGKQAPA